MTANMTRNGERRQEVKEVWMPPAKGLSVKDARFAVEGAMDAARTLGISEEQLRSDPAVRAAADNLTLAQTAEHLQVLRTRRKSKVSGTGPR